MDQFLLIKAAKSLGFDVLGDRAWNTNITKWNEAFNTSVLFIHAYFSILLYRLTVFALRIVWTLMESTQL